MKREELIRLAIILQRIGLYGLLGLSILLLIFALISGSESFGGGLEGIIKNSPNALPWLGLLLIAILSFKRPQQGGYLTVIAGFVLMYFFNFRGENFFLLTFVFCLLIILLGFILIISEQVLKKQRGGL